MSPSEQRGGAASGVVTPINKIAISTGTREDRGTILKRKYSWDQLCRLLTEPTVDQNFTMKRYHESPKGVQGDLKASPGWFCGTLFEGNKRYKTKATVKTIVTFDIDDGSPELMSEIFGPFEIALRPFLYCAHTTRSHLIDAPRVRIVVPLAEPLPVDRALAVTRFMAKLIDPKMKTVDKVSFDAAQVMYWPSVNSDGMIDFKKIVNQGSILDGEAFLEEMGWDGTLETVPMHPDESAVLESGTKLGDPRLKPGAIGAFNSTYDIPRAIEEFIPDAYTFIQDGLYFWTGSENGTPGARVYDDGWGPMRMFSMHGTDPATRQSCHPFDLVRIHKFGHLDEKVKDAATGRLPKDVMDLPSMKAMTEFVYADEGCQDELQRRALDNDALAEDGFEAEDDVISEVTSENKKVGADALPRMAFDKTWTRLLDSTKKGIPKNTRNNVAIVLEHHACFINCFAYNELMDSVVLLRPLRSKSAAVDTGPIKDSTNGDRLTDIHITAIGIILSAPLPRKGRKGGGLGLNSSREVIDEHVTYIAKRRSFHPVQQYLRTLVWDGKTRIEKLLPTYCGAEDTPLHRDMGRKFLLGAVARAMTPGCKFDWALIFKSQQGSGKSSFIHALGGEWTREFSVSFSDAQKLSEAISGAWFVEMPELSSMYKSEIEDTKRGLTATSDQYRQPFARKTSNIPRRCVMAGSTNKTEFLKDDENRRFWVVDITGKTIDIKAVYRDRNQLFAEAYQQWGEMWLDHDTSVTPWLNLDLDDSNKPALVETQEKHKVDDGTDALAGMIRGFLDEDVPPHVAKPGYYLGGGQPVEDYDGELVKRDRIVILELAWRVFGVVPEKFDTAMNTRIRKALLHIGGWVASSSNVRVKREGAPDMWQKFWTRVHGDDPL